jgi:hypothetical protein
VGLYIILHNDGTGINGDANYDYIVQINQLVIARGRVEHHNRDAGWEALIRRVADQEQCRRLSSST